ncbi:MAG: hypothetical protein KGH60_00365 [Candidatus Micrarchaeota archaeon]|nr:hypothetical protein [Candidatus Micrarchaeota archaeon]
MHKSIGIRGGPASEGREEAFRELASMARGSKPAYMKFFEFLVQTPEHAVVAATDFEVASVPTTLHGNIGIDMSGYAVHLSVYQHEAAAIVMVKNLYGTLSRLNGAQAESVMKAERVRIAALTTESGRSAVEVSYTMHESVRQFINSHQAFKQSLSRLGLM